MRQATACIFLQLRLRINIVQSSAKQQKPFFPCKRRRTAACCRTSPRSDTTQEAIDRGEERHRGLDGHEIPTIALFLSYLKDSSQPRGLGTFCKRKERGSKISYDMLPLNSLFPHQGPVCWGGFFFFLVTLKRSSLKTTSCLVHEVWQPHTLILKIRRKSLSEGIVIESKGLQPAHIISLVKGGLQHMFSSLDAATCFALHFNQSKPTTSRSSAESPRTKKRDIRDVAWPVAAKHRPSWYICCK